MSAVRNASTLCLSALLSVFTLALVAPDQAMASAKKDGTETQPPRTSILMVREDGQAIDPVTSKLLDEPGHYEEYDRYIDAIFRGIEGFCATKPKPCNLLFYFHGGLNNRESSVGRATELTETIKGQDVYPIFVNWNSSLVSTWWDHVAHVHRGLWQGNRYLAAVPYFIAVDEAKSIAEAPTAWVAEARHTFPHEQEAGVAVLQTYQELIQMHEKDNDSTLDLNNLADGLWLVDNRKPAEILRAKAKLLYSWPTKLLAPPLLIQAAGTGAWDMMQRRTAMLFRTEAEFRGVSRKAVEESRKGNTPVQAEQKKAVELARQYDTGAALARFIDRFQEEFLPRFCRVPAEEATPDTPKEHQEGAVACEKRLEVTLVGHSMGTIIIDRLLRYAPNLQVKNIVFMAAATSVEDYRDTVDAYLDRHRGNDGDKSTGTQMYHLVLHPLAEVTEQGVFDLAPRGSLLIWIDNYFTNPPTPLGRRVGRFSNVVPELRFAGKTTRPHVHLKVFQVGGDLQCWNPQKHGDFGDFPFWDERFWDPKESTGPTSPIRRRDEVGCPTQTMTAGKANEVSPAAVQPARSLPQPPQ
jgi:pimeloyl-ACP methyl ester carboxylesterase